METHEFRHHFADLGEVTMHYVTAGDGLGERPPIVLVHGWPETWYEWRHVMPRLAMGGGKTGARGRTAEPEASMRRVATDVTGFVIPDSGHFVPEEQPDVVADHILEHIARHGG